VGMKFVTRALAYLRGRESARQVIMSQSMSNLAYLAGQGNTDARQRLDQISRDLDGERKGSDRGGGGDRQRSHPDDDRR
jgi:hypothetical protein